MKDVLKIIGVVLGVLGIIGSALSARLSGPVFIVLLVLELVSVINIGWLMVFVYPLIMLFGGLCLAGLSTLFVAIVGDSIK